MVDLIAIIFTDDLIGEYFRYYVDRKPTEEEEVILSKKFGEVWNTKAANREFVHDAGQILEEMGFKISDKEPVEMVLIYPEP